MKDGDRGLDEGTGVWITVLGTGWMRRWVLDDGDLGRQTITPPLYKIMERMGSRYWDIIRGLDNNETDGATGHGNIGGNVMEYFGIYEGIPEDAVRKYYQ